MDSGKMTGDAYISNRTPKPIRKRISRYFEVMAENKSPNPSPWIPMIKINIGSSKKILYDSSSNIDSLQNSHTCLVLADGDREVCAQMLLFANALASLNPEIQFIFRLHPRTNKQLLLWDDLIIF